MLREVKLQFINKFRSYKIENELLWCDVSTFYPRPVVPEPSKKTIFDSLHQISHPGVESSLKLIKARYYWHNIDKDIRKWCRECTQCKQAKISRHTKASETN